MPEGFKDEIFAIANQQLAQIYLYQIDKKNIISQIEWNKNYHILNTW